MHRALTTRWLSPSVRGLILISALGLLATACATSRAFQRGGQAAMRGDWDVAVSYYTTALRGKPERVEYRLALERAQISAAQVHFDSAREMERRDQLDVALMEYRKAVDYYPGNQEARAKISSLEKTLRARVEASRPRPAIEAMREQARKAPAEPQLDLKSRELLDFELKGGELRDVLIGMGKIAGVSVNFDWEFRERKYAVDLKAIAFEDALQLVTAANQLFYKVTGDHSILVIPDTPQKRQANEEQAVQTFYLSHADPAKLVQLITRAIAPTQAIPPVATASTETKTILVRASVPMLQAIGRIIEANDKPRAEVVIDMEILEINRSRAKQYGIELGQYQVGLSFSPESAPGGSTTGTGTGATATTGGGAFNLNTVSKGVSTNDFYASVPSALIKFLESDTNTKVIAKPQLRGTEGETLTLNLGDEVPVPSTTFTPMVSGGTSYNPMTSFQMRPVGVGVKLEPRVTYDGDVTLKLELEVSAQSADKNVAGQNLPTFTSRKVATVLRLRDGESNLLAGLLREDERTSLKGLPGILRLPLISRLFGSTDTSVAQTDIVMLLTPHIVRTHELTQQDFMPIYIGSQQSLGLSGPPPTIGGQAIETETTAPPAAPPAAQQSGLAQGAVVPGPPGSPIKAVIPPGSSPIPGTVGVPMQAPAAAPAQPPQLVAPPTNPAAAQPPQAATPAPSVAGATTRVLAGAPTTPMVVAGGPYAVPLAISGTARVTTVSLAVVFNPRVLRVRLPQEGDYMRQGGAKVTFSHKIDEAQGRIDLTLTRSGDSIGATGDGVLASIVFDAIGAGSSPVTVSGAASGPGGTAVPLQFVPITVVVR